MVIVVASLVTLSLLARQEERHFSDERIKEGHKVARIITGDLTRRMLAGGGKAVWDSISEDARQYAEATGASRILVLSTSGSVKASSDPTAVGSQIDVRDEQGCPRCTSTRMEDFPVANSVATSDGDRVLRIVNPIAQLPACSACHKENQPLRGYLAIDFDLQPLDRAARERRIEFLSVGLLSGVLVMVIIALLFRRLVLRPIASLGSAARRLASGDLPARAQVFENNELARLAMDFNVMAARVEEQVGRLEAANVESTLLYTLVVEASRNLETAEFAAGVIRVIQERLGPRHAAFFLESSSYRWICALGNQLPGDALASGEGSLENVIAAHSAQVMPLLDDIPPQLAADVCQTRTLHRLHEGANTTFVLPVLNEGRLIGLLCCSGVPKASAIDSELLDNLGAHLGLSAANSRNYTRAITDGLTDLRNRRYGMVRLQEALHSAKRYRSNLGLLICDIDNFKRINDTYGHPAGDAVLRQVSGRIAAAVRKADIVVRYGGEEFMVIMPESVPQALSAVGEKIRDAIGSAPFQLGSRGGFVAITVSVGVTACDPDSDSVDSLIEKADKALYRAKQGGRDRVEIET